jgi:glycosyltransferase involved in cell wall biosynthesis
MNWNNNATEAAGRNPRVSVILPNYNGGAFLGDAITSACRQSLREIEIIVIDDASTDDSVDVVRKLMQQDHRIQLLTSDRNRGPSAARNKGLRAARGEWIAILDGDDMMHPDRLASLVEAGTNDCADIVADDLLIFHSTHSEPPQTLLRGRWARAPFWLETETYVRRNILLARRPGLGYLKPVFRASFLSTAAILYDERLRLAEDFHFVLRLLQHGARFRVYPLLLYFYRRHKNSISHRLTSDTLQAIKQVDAEVRAHWDPCDEKLMAAIDARTRSIEAAIAFDRMVWNLKRRDWINFGRIALANPSALLLLRQPIVARLKRCLSARAQNDQRGKIRVCVLARRWVVDASNGRLIELRSLVQQLAEHGIDVHLVSLSPAAAGQWAGLTHLKSSSAFRGVVRGLIAFIERVLLLIGRLPHSVRKTRISATAPLLSRRDQLFIAEHVAPNGDVLIVDGCLLAGAFPYALRPTAKTAIVMRGVVSSLTQMLAASRSSHPVLTLSEDEECELLAKADAIVTFGKEELEFLKKKSPRGRIIFAPVANRVEIPQPGSGDNVLFVGDATAANVDGLAWFLDECWPKIRSQRKDLTFRIAGDICETFVDPPDRVQLLGFVQNMGSLYANAGVVVFPQRVGPMAVTGVLEALARGKAVVVTMRTLEVLQRLAPGTVRAADEPDRFASIVAEFLASKSLREAAGGIALQTIKEHFSGRAYHESLLDFVNAEALVDADKGKNKGALIGLDMPTSTVALGSQNLAVG